MKDPKVSAFAYAAIGIGVALLAFFLGRALPSNSSESARIVDLVQRSRVEVEGLRESIRNLTTELRDWPKAQKAGTEGPPTGGVPVADLLRQADQLRTKKRFREAEIILTRAVQTDRDNVDAWRSLAAVQRELANESIVAGNLLSAAQAMDRARTTVNGVIGISVDPSTQKMDPKIVVDEEAATAQLSATVREAIDNSCAPSIVHANEWAKYSHWGWYTMTKNNRDGVIEGLKSLKTVFELGPWASESTRMSANDAYSKLKNLVNPEEWNDLLARAGFDPSSRDTLKKWGLE